MSRRRYWAEEFIGGLALVIVGVIIFAVVVGLVWAVGTLLSWSVDCFGRGCG